MIIELIPQKELDKIKSFLKTKKALIIEDKKTSRSTLKKNLVSFGVPITSIDTADSHELAKEMFSSNKYDIVFCNYIIKEQDATYFIDIHTKSMPNRSRAFFVILSSPNSIASACKVLDSEIDEYIAEPYSATSLSETFYNLTKRKMNNSKSYLEYHNAKAAIYSSKLEDAEAHIENIKSLEGFIDEAYYLEGKLYKMHGDTETALLFFSKALEYNPKHYLALKELINGSKERRDYKSAYAHTQTLLENYPINPTNLPDLIRLSLLNKKYEDLLSYSKFFHSLDEKCPSIKTSIAASLVICGKYFFEIEDKQRAVQTLLEAVKSSSGKFSIIENIVKILMTNDEVRIANEVLSSFKPLLGTETSFQVLEVELCCQNNDISGVLRKGLPLAQKGVVDKSLFAAVIKSSVKAKRSENNIVELIDSASKHFPDDTEYFHGLREKY